MSVHERFELFTLFVRRNHSPVVEIHLRDSLIADDMTGVALAGKTGRRNIGRSGPHLHGMIVLRQHKELVVGDVDVVDAFMEGEVRQSREWLDGVRIPGPIRRFNPPALAAFEEARVICHFDCRTATRRRRQRFEYGQVCQFVKTTVQRELTISCLVDESQQPFQEAPRKPSCPIGLRVVELLRQLILGE